MITPFLVALALSFAPPAPPTICIDPGHPSENGNGSHGKKLTEIHVTWKVANELKSELTKSGYFVVITKSSENQRMTNKQRAEFSNQQNPKLFLRLHCDAGAASGLGTYYPGKQGKAHGVTGPSKEVIKASKAFAPIFHKAVMKQLSDFPNRGCHPESATRIGAKQGALTGSIFSKKPVLLVEMCVLTNAKDEARMLAPGGYHKMALALKAGVKAIVPPPF